MNIPDANSGLSRAETRQNLMEAFLKLTETQTDAINNYDYETILNTIKQKQNLIEQINLINLQSKDESPEDNEALRLIEGRTRELMARAIVIDDANQASLKQQQAQTLEKLKLARQKRATHTLYRGKNVNMEGILLDQKK
ncbi:MAG: hypothetical protein VB084_02585 [Syntrophomonadaceae bacterium]|nr:hypothetical protein [Syntrophomonadaceae bacterium]